MRFRRGIICKGKEKPQRTEQESSVSYLSADRCRNGFAMYGKQYDAMSRSQRTDIVNGGKGLQATFSARGSGAASLQQAVPISTAGCCAEVTPDRTGEALTAFLSK